MSGRLLAFWLTCIAAIVVLVFIRRTLETSLRASAPPSTIAPAAAAVAANRPAAAPDALAASTPAAGQPTALLVSANVTVPAASGVPAMAITPDMEFTNFPPTTVMENMSSAVHAYAARFNGNPVGTNPEIAAALHGRNPGQVNFLRAEDGLRLNERGELVDPWGTPYFFHQMSAKEMEIHSAGPDRVMWTADDLVGR